MRVTFNKKEFLNALEIGGAFAMRGKSVLPILDCVKLSIKDNRLVIVSTDNENAVSKAVDCIESDGNVECCVNYKDLFSYVKLISGDSFTMTFNDNDVCISHDKGKMSIPTQSIEDYPEISGDEYANSIEMSSAILNNWIVEGQQFVADDALRLVMNTIYFYHRDGELGCCATDAHVLFWDKDDCDMSDFEFNLNKNAFRAICTALKDTETVNISIGDRDVKFNTSSCSVLARKIEQRFPNFKSVIPNNNNIEVKASTSDMIDAVNRVKLGANTKNPELKLCISGMNMEISCEDIDFSKKSVETMFVDSGGDITIGLNAQMLSKILSSIGTENVVMMFSDNKHPVLLSEDSEESNKLFLQMPILLI